MKPRILHTLIGIMILSISNLTSAADECTASAEYEYQTANHTVFFHNTSSSTGNANVWAWDFGDGNFSEIVDPVHAYANYGTYRCCLTITSDSPDGSCSDTFCMDVEVQSDSVCTLISDFEIEPLLNGEAMFIPDCQTNVGTTIDGFSWIIDGTEIADETPMWQFYDVEPLQVCLTASASAAGNTCADVKCKNIVIDNFVCELGAEFKLTQKECGVDLNYQFDQLGDFTEATDFTWTFSDGTQLEGANVYQSFTEFGSYEVCLTVLGNCPSSDCTSEQCMTFDVVCPEHVEWNTTDLNDMEDVKDESDTALNLNGAEDLEIKVYPNPTTGFLRIESQVGIKSISAWTTTGQMVLKEAGHGMKQHITDISSLIGGMYLYHIELSDGQIVAGHITKL